MNLIYELRTTNFGNGAKLVWKYLEVATALAYNDAITNVKLLRVFCKKNTEGSTDNILELYYCNLKIFLLF